MDLKNKILLIHQRLLHYRCESHPKSLLPMNVNNVDNIPRFIRKGPFHQRLSHKRSTQWSWLKYEVNFRSLRHLIIEMKKVILLWKILHRGIWTRTLEPTSYLTSPLGARDATKKRRTSGISFAQFVRLKRLGTLCKGLSTKKRTRGRV
ncbi:hypothetical protein KP509_39G046300 [Ceratopteris richardii]|uniref:Uncharacterized protein n=1 Tax=Ceratopteris richardii TaxID=49495 RepID=A0A8T2Q117_CERRI|nr:hypothetical protein KP509_39G046300 [Ceratopteris richardii]